jgi:hypothetical protein
MRDALAYLGALYGAAVALSAGFTALLAMGFDYPARFGIGGSAGLSLMGVGIASYGLLKFAVD